MPGDSLSVIGSLKIATSDVVQSGEFLSAQLRSAIGDQSALELTAGRSDPLLGGIMQVFPLADRDQDAQLSIAELQAYIALVELRLQSQLHVRLVDQERNLVPLLYTNGDGLIDSQEAVAH